jgi:hypothetical protein
MARYVAANTNTDELWYNVVLDDAAEFEADGTTPNADRNAKIDQLVNALLSRDAIAAMGENYSAMAENWLLNNCRTDLGFSGAENRQLKTKRSDIEALPTVFKVSPTDLDLQLDFENAKFPSTIYQDANGVIQGSFLFKYTNNNNNTNLPFHIYIPLEVTYFYANKTPAAPIIVWAAIEVQSSKANETTTGK